MRALPTPASRRHEPWPRSLPVTGNYRVYNIRSTTRGNSLLLSPMYSKLSFSLRLSSSRVSETYSCSSPFAPLLPLAFHLPFSHQAFHVHRQVYQPLLYHQNLPGWLPTASYRELGDEIVRREERYIGGCRWSWGSYEGQQGFWWPRKSRDKEPRGF